jgi:hypothetical protein
MGRGGRFGGVGGRCSSISSSSGQRGWVGGGVDVDRVSISVIFSSSSGTALGFGGGSRERCELVGFVSGRQLRYISGVGVV